jgi:cytochrome c-type biogenesis protein CcmF
MAFGFSLVGAFIVRSGVLTSVHAFANDPERGVFILLILAIFMGGALVLFAARAHVMEAKGVFSTVSRETGILANNILLTVSAFVVFIGTIWPLIAEMAFDRKLSVGPPFFDAAFTPFVVAIAVLLPLGSVLPWKRARLGRAAMSLWPLAILVFASAALAFSVQTGTSALAPVGIALGVWVVIGASLDLWQRAGRGVLGERIGRLGRLPRADWGKAVAHIGFGLTVTGVAVHLAWQVEDIRVAREGERFAVASYEIELRDVREVEGPNYRSTMAEMAVYRNDREVAILFPEKRVYPVAQMPTTEAAIDNGFWRDVYLVIGDPQDGGGWAVRTYIKPLANWIWGGSVIMALGGVLSLTDRRYRVAAGARKTAPGAVPAE